MDTEEYKEMNRLCTLMKSEQNPAKFFALLEKLNALLERKEKRLVEKLRESIAEPRDSRPQAA
jgi:hypothetical protein